MKYRHLITIVSGLLLAACSSGTVKNTLGLDRAAPDEFRVVSRPPLSVPPEFNLRPPSATDESPNQQPMSKQAQSLVLGGGSTTAAASSGKMSTASIPATSSPSDARPGSSAESQFLQDVGASQADPKVRDKIVEDRIAAQQKQEEKDNSSWWDIFSSDAPKKDPIVSAQQETDRIKQNQDTGTPVTTGDTPNVKQKDTGLLGQILGY